MKRYRITNKSDVDICIDVVGKNKVEDKIILHPRMSITKEVADAALPAIKANPGLVVVPA